MSANPANVKPEGNPVPHKTKTDHSAENDILCVKFLVDGKEHIKRQRAQRHLQCLRSCARIVWSPRTPIPFLICAPPPLKTESELGGLDRAESSVRLISGSSNTPSRGCVRGEETQGIAIVTPDRKWFLDGEVRTGCEPVIDDRAVRSKRGIRTRCRMTEKIVFRNPDLRTPVTQGREKCPAAKGTRCQSLSCSRPMAVGSTPPVSHLLPLPSFQKTKRLPSAVLAKGPLHLTVGRRAAGFSLSISDQHLYESGLAGVAVI